MPMLDIPNRARELGRIRMGDQAVSEKSGKSYPRKLETWRLTSPQRDYVDAAAEVYGGTVSKWEGAPTEGDQWQITVGTDTLDVLVPPLEIVDAISQWWELWSGGGCVRRCNGKFESMTGEQCLCPADIAERLELSKKIKPEACKPTTRVTLILPRLPDLGVWRLEAKGMNAAVELPGAVSLLQRFAGQGAWIPARLRIDQRTAKKDGKTHHFGVPVLEVPQVTFGELIAGAEQKALADGQRALAPAPSEASTGEGTSAPPAADAGASPTTRGKTTAPVRNSPNPSKSSSAVFARSIRTTAKRLHVDDELLASVVEEISGDPDVDKVHDPAHGNAILEELQRIATEARRAEQTAGLAGTKQAQEAAG